MSRVTWVVLIVSIIAIATAVIIMKKKNQCSCNGQNGCDCDKATANGETPTEEEMGGETASALRVAETNPLKSLGGTMIETGVIKCWCKSPDGDLHQKPCGTSCISIKSDWTEAGQWS